MRRLIPATLVLALGLVAGPRAGGQAPRLRPDSVGQFLADLEAALASGRRDALATVASAQLPPAQAALFSDLQLDEGPERPRAAARERERRARGDGYDVVVDLLVSQGLTGRLATWELTLRPGASAPDRLEIAALKRLAHLEGLVRLSLDARHQYAVKNFEFTAPDFVLRIPSGTAFAAVSDAGPTGLVLHGRGELHFTPPDPAEQAQLRIFARHPSLDTPIEDVYLRVNPSDLDAHLARNALVPAPLDSGTGARAQEIFDRFAPRSFNLNLGDLSPDKWSILPAAGNVAIEFKSSRYGWLTYARSVNDPEDVNLFDREHNHNLSMYASSAKVASRGRFYDEDAGAAYDVVNYGVDVAFDPARSWIGGRGRLRLRFLSETSQSVSLRLAEPLTVASVSSPELGRLLPMRVIGQTTLLVSLPDTMSRGREVTFEITYSGTLPPQELGNEAMNPGTGRQQPDVPEVIQKPELRFMYSNRAYWYPQALTTDYAPAAMRLTVPAEYQIVASGTQIRSATSQSMLHGESRPVRTVDFLADRPIRYLACEITRLLPVGQTTVAVPALAAPADRPSESILGAQLPVDVLATPRVVGANRNLPVRAAQILSVYAALLGEAPYPSLTITAADALLPGGHSPPFFALVQQPLPTSPYVWREDPLSFDRFPDYLLAHEIAHQWWGQAVGYKNYHDQWISEGLSQYMAAMFLESDRPDLARSLYVRMRVSAEAVVDKGPIYLGYRLGHIEGRGATFRAIVYNKSAIVLHMLRRLIGDEPFRQGLRNFYRTWRFRKAGTDDFRAALEAEAQRPLARFFDQWILGSTLPHVRVTPQIDRDGSTATVRIEQIGEAFEFPLTVVIQYADGRNVEHTIAVSEPVRDHRVPLNGRVRRIVTKDELTLAVWEN